MSWRHVPEIPGIATLAENDDQKERNMYEDACVCLFVSSCIWMSGPFEPLVCLESPGTLPVQKMMIRSKQLQGLRDIL